MLVLRAASGYGRTQAYPEVMPRNKLSMTRRGRLPGICSRPSRVCQNAHNEELSAYKGGLY
jgi:hypothetical protein